MKRGHEGTTLTDAVRLWPTPDAASWAGQNRSESEGAAERPALAKLVKHWETPTAGVHGQPGGGRGLEQEAMRWPTPTAEERNQYHSQDNGMSLGRTSREWATPQARDWRAETGEYRPDHFPTLGRQVRQTAPAGAPSSSTIRRLSPLFVEWLMGLPRGWTASEPSAKAWSPWWRRMRSALWQLEHGSRSPS